MIVTHGINWLAMISLLTINMFLMILLHLRTVQMKAVMTMLLFLMMELFLFLQTLWKKFCLKPVFSPLTYQLMLTEYYLLHQVRAKHPLSMQEDDKFEEMCFPKLFFHLDNLVILTRDQFSCQQKYFQKRSLQKGGRFSSNIEYLFVAQFLCEWKQILSSMSIALRKSLSGKACAAFTAGDFKNADYVRPLLTKDDAYRFYVLSEEVPHIGSLLCMSCWLLSNSSKYLPGF